jgi:hypothetical protein
MKKLCLLLGILFVSLIIVACTNPTIENSDGKDSQRSIGSKGSTGNPTVEEILQTNKDADIFVLNGIVYKNAEDIDWVNAKNLTLGEKVIEITKQTNDSKDFQNGTATNLPIGTRIYEPVEKGDIYIAIVEDKEIRYLGLREG